MRTKKTSKKKKVLTPAELDRLQHIKEIQCVMKNIGFKRFPSVDGKHFQYNQRREELDDIFYCKNVMLIIEYTTQDNSDHLLKKKVIFDLINEDKVSFIDFLLTDPMFAKQAIIIQNEILTHYTKNEIQLKIVYAAKTIIDKEHKELIPYVSYLDYPIVKYFEAISKTIKKTTLYEFADFLHISFNNLGENIKQTGQSSSTFTAQILPEEKSCFDTGYKIISFYMDAQSLLSRVYVLRNDGWRDLNDFEHYQRLIIGKKIRSMRKYLHERKRVFVNNIIATLSTENITLFDKDHKSITINDSGNYVNTVATNVHPAYITIENTSNIIGIIDGQHRIYAYHEGDDLYEDTIKQIRKVQNLLVTAILYPKKISESERLKFEAQLFLEINATQQSASTNLIQTIERIINPDSITSMAKYIVSKLNQSGVLKGIFGEHWYEKDKIKTVSVISFGLKPLIKTKGNDSLFALWQNPEKNKLNDKELCTEELLKEYKDFCVQSIVDIFRGINYNISKEKWKLSRRNEDGILNVTTINGIFNCLRFLIENNQVLDYEDYKKAFQDIDNFQFKQYKSSQYRPMGKELFTKYLKHYI